jgi:hypothetical protein
MTIPEGHRASFGGTSNCVKGMAMQRPGWATQFGLFMAAIPALASWAFSGCGTTEQQVSTFVRDAAVSGPLFSPPINPVSEKSPNTVTLSASMSGMRKSLLEGVIVGSEPGKSDWLYSYDTVQLSGGGVAIKKQIPQYNLSWKQPRFSAGLNCDVAWRSVALSFGGSLSTSSGYTLYGWSAGIGLFSSELSNVRARLDLGIFGQNLHYNARSVAITTTTTSWIFGGSSTTVDTTFYHDATNESSIGYYGSIILNSAFTSSPVNFFLQGSLVSQPILHYKPYTKTTVNWLMFVPLESTDSRGEVSTDALLLGITPGIYMEPSKSLIVVAGVRCLFDVSETFTGETSVIMPFVQVGLRTGL